MTSHQIKHASRSPKTVCIRDPTTSRPAAWHWNLHTGDCCKLYRLLTSQQPMSLYLVQQFLLVRLPSLLRLGLAQAVHARLLAGAALMLHKLMGAWARLIGVLVQARESSTSHSVHGLILLNWGTVHRATALCMMHLRRSVHR